MEPAFRRERDRAGVLKGNDLDLLLKPGIVSIGAQQSITTGHDGGGNYRVVKLHRLSTAAILCIQPCEFCGFRFSKAIHHWLDVILIIFPASFGSHF